MSEVSGGQRKRGATRRQFRREPPADLRGGQVTALDPQVKHANRYNLSIDHRFVMGLSAVVALRLRIGQTLTTEEVGALARAEQLEQAHEDALRKLETRPRSAEEIRRALSAKKYPDDIIAQVCERLAEAGLLSDREFAKFWVENRDGFKPRSARALKYELRQKGVPADEIARAVRKVDEADSAYRAARPKAERLSRLGPEDFRAKLTGFLARRGFDYQVCRATVARLWKELHDQDLMEEE